MASITLEQAIKDALSGARVGTYEVASTVVPRLPVLADALALYAWNAQVSAALMVPLHICEVVIRNAVSDALERVYGPTWPWSPGFERSLPTPAFGYSAKNDLLNVRHRFPTTGKVIPELKFIFWQTMFTSRFDRRLWSPHLLAVLPHLDGTKPIAQLRGTIFADLEALRLVRNRIAHHEPIFVRNLTGDFQKIHELIGFRCPITAAWMLDHEQASAFMAAKP
jgi:hypothetical protein